MPSTYGEYAAQEHDAISKGRIRSLGQIQLCGVLYICWQTKDSVQGSYLICLLYRRWLCFALAEKSKVGRIYTIQACIPLNGCSIEEVDNGRGTPAHNSLSFAGASTFLSVTNFSKGLQCHSAPFSWKLVFECEHQLYEVLMAACTQKEERQWKKRIGDYVADNACTQLETLDAAFLALNITRFGTVFGSPGAI